MYMRGMGDIFKNGDVQLDEYAGGGLYVPPTAKPVTQAPSFGIVQALTSDRQIALGLTLRDIVLMSMIVYLLMRKGK